jgi:hypothetical protein
MALKETLAEVAKKSGSAALVAAMAHVPVLASIVTTPDPEFTEQIDGDVVANATAPAPLPPVTPNVAVPENSNCAGTLVMVNPL